MADFYELHKSQLPNGQVKPGDVWRVAVREPFLTTLPKEPGIIQVVCFLVKKDGSFKPVSAIDHAIIVSWNNRHKGTPLSAFELPQNWLSDGENHD